MLKNYASKIQELEGELLHLKNLNSSKRSRFVECADLDDDGLHSKNELFPCTNEFSSDYDIKAMNIPGSICKALFIVLLSFILLNTLLFVTTNANPLLVVVHRMKAVSCHFYFILYLVIRVPQKLGIFCI